MSTLSKTEIIRRKKDIERVFSTGRKYSNTAGARLMAVDNGLDSNRLLICIVRKFGTAVERNRAKRIAREFYRNNKYRMKTGFDFALIIYPGKYENDERFRQFEYLFKKADFFEKSQ